MEQLFYQKININFPLKIISSNMPIGINYKAGVSAQLKSAVIFAGLNLMETQKLLKQKKVEIILKILLLKNLQE